MSFYLYILRCSDGSYYTGHTDDLESRLAAHQMGLISGYTRDRRPMELVFSEEFASRVEALERERQIKGWSRKKKDALICRDWDLLRKLARSRGSTRSPRTEKEARDERKYVMSSNLRTCLRGEHHDSPRD